MGFRVEGVTEASLTSECLLHACSSIHGGQALRAVEPASAFQTKMFAAAYCESLEPGATHHGGGGSPGKGIARKGRREGF